jgi:hypothetical protein
VIKKPKKKKNLKVTLKTNLEESLSEPVSDPASDVEELIIKSEPRNREKEVISTPPRQKALSFVTSNYTLKKSPSSSTSRLIVETVRNKQPYQIRLRMDIDSIPEEVDRKFITSNQPFSNPKTHQQYLCNSIAWKLVYLNRDLLDGNLELLQRAVDVYMLQYEDSEYAPRPGKRLIQVVFPEQDS